MDVVVASERGVDPLERETIRRVAWRLLPLVMLTYFCCNMDKVNVGMAATTMNHDLGFSAAVFGFGAGVFFVGYCVAEIPSNLILNMVGARRWLARILISWGILSGLTAFVWNGWSFYTVRFVLGLAEAGCFPGVVLYLTWWFPSHYRSRMQAIFFSSAIISLIVGPPIGGLLLRLDGLLGLHGWQLLFLIEALPSIVMCFVVWRLLTDRPADATWLRADQRAWLAERMAAERAQREAIRKYSLAETFSNPKVWLLTLAWFGQNTTNLVLMFFMPLIVKGLGVPTDMIGLVTSVPFLFAFVAVIWWGWHSDRTGERTWHAAGAWLLVFAALAVCILIGRSHPILLMVALTLATMGNMSTNAVFWALPSAILSGAAAAGGIAMINAVGNLGGWIGPWAFGLVKDATGSDNIALLCMALGPIVSAIAVVLAGHDRRLERIPPRARAA